ncbi:hypothetical protein D3C87_1597240 [compost metagenome]
MEDVGYTQTIFFGQIRNASENPWQLAAGDCAVHAVVVGREAPDGWKGILASCPELDAFIFITSQTNFRSTGDFQYFFNAVTVVLNI